MSPVAAVDFNKTIAPILEAKCLSCHNDNTRKGDLSLSTASDLLEGELTSTSEEGPPILLEVVTSESGARPSMPKKGDPLST